jgi:hypothetical protein
LTNVPAGNQTVTASLADYYDTGVGNTSIVVVNGGIYSAGTLVLSKIAGSSVFLSKLTPESSDYKVQTVYLSDSPYSNALVRKTPGGGAPFMSPTTAIYKLDKKYARFSCTVGGLERKLSTLEMVFRVYGDGELLYESPNLKPSPTVMDDREGHLVDINLDVSAVNTLKLEVSTVKVYWVTGDYAWYNPTLTRKDTL